MGSNLPIFSKASDVLWVNVIYGIVKIALGVIIVWFGKKYYKKMEGAV